MSVRNVELIYRCIYEHSFLNLELRNIEIEAIEYSLLMGTLKNYYLCKYQWQDLVTKKVNRKIEILLNLSVYRFYFMHNPLGHVIVNEAVNVAKKIDYGASGLVNAVLRKVFSQELKYANSGDEIKDVSINYSLPEWIYRLFVGQYGVEVANNISQHFLKPLDRCGWVYDNNEIKLLPLSEASKYSLYLPMDKNSYAVIDSLDIDNPNKILDGCAAPGTKTILMALKFRDSLIDAIEINESRSKLIDNSVKRFGLEKRINVYNMDFLNFDSSGLYDLVFLDVPCSGLGVLAHKPDLKFHISSTDLDNLQQLAFDILVHGSKFVRVGGFLVLATCTLNKKENERQVIKFLKANPNFELVSEKCHLGFDNNGGGFYFAQLKRIS